MQVKISSVFSLKAGVSGGYVGHDAGQVVPLDNVGLDVHPEKLGLGLL